jgi:hypothetical protein
MSVNLSVRITDKDSGWDKLARNLEKVAGKAVDVGIQGNEDSDLLQYANVQEFGAEIDHPGGTSYGFKSKADVERNKISFLKKGQGYIELGVTGPHKINVPARPFIRQTFTKREQELSRIGFEVAGLVVDGKITIKQALENWGDQFVAFIRSEVSDGNNFEPNAPSTIRKKGAGLHPLQDSGRLMQALKAVVVEV